MNTIFSLADSDLSKLSSEQAVIVFRDLLWCSAREHGIPVTKIHISGDVTVKDGGVDASIESQIPHTPDDLLIVSGTRFQIKAGKSFKPWQKSQIKKELFGKSKPSVNLENLNSGIRECLEESKRYVVVCFGVDPTSEQIKKAKFHLQGFLLECGFRNAEIDVWGQTQLIGLLTEYPSLCMKILGKSDYVFQTLESWSKNADMQTQVRFGAQHHELIATVQEDVRADHYHHIRLIGEPGIGKSRLILEALSTEDLSPCVIYFSHPQDFQQSQLFNEIIRVDTSLYVILVIDECAEKEKVSIWNSLWSHSDKCTLITIDHGPDYSADSKMQIYHCPQLPDEQIISIIRGYLSENFHHHASHWASLCSGSPRVAHAVGENLANNPDDVLKSPATVQIWDRFIAGYEDTSSENNQRRLIVLQHISLFYKFGFEQTIHADLHNEAKFISELVTEVDPSITWGRFTSIVKELKERRILQGKNTLFIVPKALHVYLWLDYWKHYGTVFSIEDILQKLPDTLKSWFMHMFIYANDNSRVQNVVRDVLQPGGIFDDRAFLASYEGCHFLSILAEADPRSTLQCLQRTFGNWSKDELLAWRDGRQNIVWALEKIAVWDEHFVGATRLLLKLGAAENNSINSNNSCGTFAELFSLGRGSSASTEAPPSKRLIVLRQALESGDTDERLLGLKACQSALSLHPLRFIGAEYQGIKALPKLWTPQVWGEVFDAYTNVWNLVFNTSRVWELIFRQQANDILINFGESVLRFIQDAELRELVFATLEALAVDGASNKRNIIQFLHTSQKYSSDAFSEDEKIKLSQLDNLIAGDTVESRTRRYVLYSCWENDDRNDDIDGKSTSSILPELALELAQNEQAFDNVIDALIIEDGLHSCKFGSLLAKADRECAMLEKIVRRRRVAGSEGNFQILNGYLAQLRELDEATWEKKVSDILNDDTLQDWTDNLLWIGGINHSVLEQMIDLYQKNKITPRYFVRLQHIRIDVDVSSDSISKVLHLLSNDGSPEAAGVSLKILEQHYCNRRRLVKFSKDLVYRIITNEHLVVDRANSMINYYWKIVCIRFLSDYPDSALNLFERLFEKVSEHSLVMLKANNDFHKILQIIATTKPSETWDIVTSKLIIEDKYVSSGVINWLGESGSWSDNDSPIRPLTYFGKERVFNWVDSGDEIRAMVLTRAVPKTLDNSADGRFTRNFIDKYGALEGISESIRSSFFTGSWAGPLSMHHRHKRDEARKWLEDETSPNVINWLERYIEALNISIEQAEIGEEREF